VTEVGTPVEVWAPAFAWLRALTVETTTSTVCGNGRRCNLCELEILGPVGDHVEHHRQELADYRDRARAEPTDGPSLRTIQRHNTVEWKKAHRERTCANEYCSITFVPGRVTRAYCSNRCRVAAARARKRHGGA
jgi:hypothetical protein